MCEKNPCIFSRGGVVAGIRNDRTQCYRYYTNGYYLCILYCLSVLQILCNFLELYHNGNTVIASEYVSVSVGYNGKEKLSIMSTKKESKSKLLSWPSSIRSDAKFLLYKTFVRIFDCIVWL